MLELKLLQSRSVYKYKTKTKALRDIRDNGLKPHQYTLIDLSNNTIYKSGMWLTPKEYESGNSFAHIRVMRKYKR